jgi:protein involved in polysaccharide export with SLBB domain
VLGSDSKVTRVLRIPVDRLLAGDPQYNVVIKPGDRITVPVDLIGEFWVMGNLRSQGAIPITGRPITLKMAVASAGGLNDLAVPQKVEVVRRIGKNKAGMKQEQIVMVDLAKIAKGEQPDFFIKPYDLINVGTTGVARWMNQLRNAFRPNYGFSFTYDRNFADLDAGNDPFPGHTSFDSIF